MKLSILTATYNRGELLKRLYESILINLNANIDVEWLIMDDGSDDNTEEIISKFIEENKLNIKYIKQVNQGKMVSINNLVDSATGDLIVECDSDDYFTKDAFEIINEEYEKYKNEKDVYAMCFLKYDQNLNNLGNNFKNKKTTMFDLYFKEGENGEKSLVFCSNIRKKYQYKIEENERFATEARMYHEMDDSYSIICINKPIMICEYQKDGYTKNIIKQFKENPKGYYWYFKEILKKDMKGVLFNKRLYAIKHYILFNTLVNGKKILGNINGIFNKVLIIVLYIPGTVKTKIKFK